MKRYLVIVLYASAIMASVVAMDWFLWMFSQPDWIKFFAGWAGIVAVPLLWVIFFSLRKRFKKPKEEKKNEGEKSEVAEK